MRKDAKYGTAIGISIVAIAAPWMVVAKLHSPAATPLPDLMVSSPAPQPTRAEAAIAAGYYRDHAGDLYERSIGGVPVLIAQHGCYVTCPLRRGRAFAILDNSVRTAPCVKIIRCDTNGSSIGLAKVTDDDLMNVPNLDSMVLLPNGHLFIDGEINPSMGIGIDVGPGEHHFFFGWGFAWDASARSVAYFHDPPRGAPPGIPSEVRVNGQAVRDIPQGSGESLHWERDGAMLDVKLEDGSSFRIDNRSTPAITSDLD